MVVLEVAQENVDEDVIKDTKDDSTTKYFTLEILKIIKNAHQQHGLRHGDFQRYRGYCSRRIRRLRKVLKIPQGDRRHFKRRDINETHLTNSKSDVRYLHLPLMLAERNWAYAMQLRQEANTEPRKKFHLTRKLRKGCKYALQLEQLSTLECCDVRTKLEAQAYVAWMHGTLHFELQLWVKAMENLKKAQMIYEKLTTALPDEEQPPYKQRVDEISPSLRYCAYNIGDDNDIKDVKTNVDDLLELRNQGILENFETLLAQTNKMKSMVSGGVLQEIEWFDIKLSIRNERVAIFLNSLQQLDESLTGAVDNSAKIKLLEDTFIDLRDIISLIRDELKSADNVSNKNDLQILLNYLISIRVDRTVLRNLFLMKQTRKPQDVCRLLDINVQQINELLQMEPLSSNEAARKYYGDNLIVYREMRAYYMAKSHATFRRWKEATLVYDHVHKLISKNLPSIVTTIKMKTEILNEMVNEIKENVLVDRSVAMANMKLEQEMIDNKEDDVKKLTASLKVYKSKKPLYDRLDEFREDPQLLIKTNPNVVTLPPAMTPVPVKPLFYDLALNHLEFPSSLQQKVEGGGGSGQQQKQSSISGFVKGLWGGWGKK